MYSHNTFEQWLHPARYRTRLCYLGANCRRPTCFFAHSVDELRSVDELETAGGGGSHAGSGPNSGGLEPRSGSGLLAVPMLPPPPPLPAGMSGDASASAASGSAAAGMVAAGMMAQQSPAAAAAGGMQMMQPMALVCMPPPPPPPQQHDSASAYRQQGGPAAAAAQQGASMMSGQNVHGAVPSPFAAVMTPGPHMGPITAVHLGPGGTMFVPPVPHGMAGASPPYMGRASMPHMGGFYAAAPAVPPPAAQPAGSRTRSWSTPGEGLHVLPYMPQGAATTPYPVDPYRHPGAAAAAMAYSPPPHPHAQQLIPGPYGSASSMGSGSRGAAPSAIAPRHMPTPTNRGGAAARRLSMPASSLPMQRGGTGYPSAAAAASDPSGASGGSHRGSPQNPQDSIEQALRHLHLTTASSPAISTAAAASRAAAAAAQGSPSSGDAVSPRAYSASPAAATPVLPRVPSASPPPLDGAAAAAAAVAEVVQRLSMSGTGAAAGSSPLMARSASVSFPTASSLAADTTADANAAAAALAAVVSATDAATALAGGMELPSPLTPGASDASYHALLQHVLRSASASAAELSGGPPTLAMLLGGAAAAGKDEDGAGPERSSDPHLRAAIRRFSSEVGYAMAASRNSDPGQHSSIPAAVQSAAPQSAMPSGVRSAASASSTGMQQLLLPLLQSILNEGLATGTLELVNGQLQFKTPGAGGGSASASGGSSACVAASRNSSSGGGSSGPVPAGLKDCGTATTGGPGAEVSAVGVEMERQGSTAASGEV